MSDFLYIDSSFRDRGTFPNPASFVMPGNKSGLYKQPRQVRALSAANQPSMQIFSYSIRPHTLIIPYTAANTNFPQLFVDFHGKTYNDINLIASQDGKCSDIRFVFDQQGIHYNSSNEPLYIKFYSQMEQVMRFKKDDDLTFKVYSDVNGTLLENGDNPIPAALNPIKQIKVTMQITAYIHDGDYSNHMAGMIATS
jgi:hypothetical protein